ncbi:26S proteasome regulatory subunit N6 [Nematocida ausubeli]|nr:26S proteasome regulatory subunit N6 [Nematocida ausubeli]
MDIAALEDKLTSTHALEIFSTELSKSISQGDTNRTDLLIDTASNTKNLSKPSIAILLKSSLDALEKQQINPKERIRIYNRLIDWAQNNKRTLLKIDFDIRKIEGLLQLREYTAALDLIQQTVKLLKRADDKIGLVKLFYLESKVYYALHNISRAKSALTLSKSTATLVYCPSYMQAKIDLLSGVYAADEGEYGISAGYLVEAMDGFILSRDYSMGLICYRYLLLVKVMDGRSGEINSIIVNKGSVFEEKDPVVDMLCKISTCVVNRDLQGCQKIVDSGSNLLGSDGFLMEHLRALCNSLIDANILKIIEPYSNISIGHIAEVLGFGVDVIEDRVRRMILDEKIRGDIDQETMCINIQKAQDGNNYRKEAQDILGILSETIDTILGK